MRSRVRPTVELAARPSSAYQAARVPAGAPRKLTTVSQLLPYSHLIHREQGCDPPSSVRRSRSIRARSGAHPSELKLLPPLPTISPSPSSDHPPPSQHQYNSSVWICTEYISTLVSLSKTQHPWTSQLPFPLYETAVHRVPLGPALIISPFNYPWKLAIEPFVTAIAAGCPALLKPAEITPATNAVLKKVIEGTWFCFRVVLGKPRRPSR